MAIETGTVVRAFDGSLADAEGLLAVERTTFDESPYTLDQIRSMFDGGPQSAWVAEIGGRIVGFLAAFPTRGLAGSRWEIDLLAVRPGSRGRGLATRLIRAASQRGSRLAPVARAVVGADNRASTRAFQRAGFRRGSAPSRLYIWRRDTAPALHPLVQGVPVREVTDVAELARWRPQALLPGSGVSLLVADMEGRPAGYAELIRVQTLLYEGCWIESLAVSDGRARHPLVRSAVARALSQGLDEVGAMVPAADRPLQDALADAGFNCLGDFYWMEARLPLPGLARTGPAAGEVPGA